jgi:hypothetical protein
MTTSTIAKLLFGVLATLPFHLQPMPTATSTLFSSLAILPTSVQPRTPLEHCSDLVQAKYASDPVLFQYTAVYYSTTTKQCYAQGWQVIEE